ncbi:MULTISPECIES: PepSY-associated TM helix domain-containing protein [Phenylobacterium]|uniref:Iron-regulated membrane protein n=1 Tax=Phenylobacterium koreense TaxID=266125 RepID=A0ABV2EI76_9CAUL
MGVVRLLHRWVGGFVGLFLALLGLSGALLVHEDLFLRASVPHAADPQAQDTASLAASVQRIFAQEDAPRSIILARQTMGLHRLNFGEEGGGYAAQSGELVTRWTSKWERPEIWLFDFHHYLLIGDAGKLVTGTMGLIGLAFVVTGVILWWPSRRLFDLRPWPANYSRNAIVRQHRDLGVAMAPVLFVSLLTGVMMTLPAVERLILAPFSPPAVMTAAQKQPEAKGGPLSPELDWSRILGDVRARYPDGEIRSISLPAKPGGLISIRVRQPAEWLPNGRTMFWFDPADGRLVDTRDALAMPLALRIANAEFPIHAAKVGGLPYRLVMTASGLSLAVLGGLAVWSFWTNPKTQARKRRGPATGRSSPAGQGDRV